MLYAVSGMKHREIAESLNLKLSNIRDSVNHAPIDLHVLYNYFDNIRKSSLD